MDIQVKSNDFQRFLKRCHCNDLIKDLVIQADDDGIHARFSTKEKTLYGEIYLPDIAAKKESGTLKIPRVKQLLSTVARINSDIVRIVTRDADDGSHEYCITDGVGVGKIKTRMLQTDDANVVESYDSLLDGKMFDTETLEYVSKVKYENGCKVDYAMLSEVLKDSKAFGYEVYRFYTKTTKKDNEEKTFLMCAITNEHTQETFNRTIAENNFIGDPKKIPDCYVGGGFREIITALIGTVDKETGEETNTPVNVSMYFDENAILLTDNKTFYFNLNTLEV